MDKRETYANKTKDVKYFFLINNLCIRRTFKILFRKPVGETGSEEIYRGIKNDFKGKLSDT